MKLISPFVIFPFVLATANQVLIKPEDFEEELFPWPTIDFEVILWFFESLISPWDFNKYKLPRPGD